jgi:hypothetical protein
MVQPDMHPPHDNREHRGRGGLADGQASLVGGDDRPEPFLLCVGQLWRRQAPSYCELLFTPVATSELLTRLQESSLCGQDEPGSLRLIEHRAGREVRGPTAGPSGRCGRANLLAECSPAGTRSGTARRTAAPRAPGPTRCACPTHRVRPRRAPMVAAASTGRSRLLA